MTAPTIAPFPERPEFFESLPLDAFESAENEQKLIGTVMKTVASIWGHRDELPELHVLQTQQFIADCSPTGLRFSQGVVLEISNIAGFLAGADFFAYVKDHLTPKAHPGMLMLAWVVAHEMAHWARNHDEVLKRHPDTSPHAFELDADNLAALAVTQIAYQLLHPDTPQRLLKAKLFAVGAIFWPIRYFRDFDGESLPSPDHPDWEVRMWCSFARIGAVGLSPQLTDKELRADGYLEAAVPIILEGEKLFNQKTGGNLGMSVKIFLDSGHSPQRRKMHEAYERIAPEIRACQRIPFEGDLDRTPIKPGPREKAWSFVRKIPPLSWVVTFVEKWREDGKAFEKLLRDDVESTGGPYVSRMLRKLGPGHHVVLLFFAAHDERTNVLESLAQAHSIYASHGGTMDAGEFRRCLADLQSVGMISHLRWPDFPESRGEEFNIRNGRILEPTTVSPLGFQALAHLHKFGILEMSVHLYLPPRDKMPKGVPETA